MGVYEEDLDADAIAKCSRALSVLDDKARVRVFKFLLDKFEMIEQPSFIPQKTHHQSSPNIAIEAVSSNNHPVSESTSENRSNEYSGNIPSLYELMKKGYTKNETDILLVLIYVKSDSGKNTIDRQDLNDAYREQDIYTLARTKNLTKCLDRLIQSSYITAYTKTKYGISDKGVKQVGLIAQGLSDSKESKPRSIKKKQQNDKQ